MFIWNLLAPNGYVSREGLLNLLAFIVALLVAMTFHEVAHGLVALHNGDTTAKNMGRLSLNPIKHFSLIGLLLMFLVGFGFAKPVPINPDNFHNRKKGMIEVSLAGVLTNIIIAFICFAGYRGLSLIPCEKDTAVYYILYFFVNMFYLTFVLNINFALFNILPLYPLDGYRFIGCFVNESNGFMTFLRKYSLYILLGFILLDNIFPMYSPLNLFISYGQKGIFWLFDKFWGLFGL